MITKELTLDICEDLSAEDICDSAVNYTLQTKESIAVCWDWENGSFYLSELKCVEKQNIVWVFTC
jgi:hypothetical protein